ncbi:MAG: lipopolysaccharide biosynthesis protein [Bacillota bacterium]
MNAALTRLKALLPKSSFARNVAVIAGGTAAGQSIVVLASPIITRLYTPEEFGVLAVYTSLLGILSVVASLRYELAIPLPEEDTDAASLLVLSLGIVVFMSLFTGLGILILDDYVAQWPDIKVLQPYLWLLPFGILMTGTYQVFNYWAVRKKAFSSIARTKLNQGIGLVLTQIILGLYKLGPLGLILGQIAGQAAGSSTLAAIFRRENSQAAEEISFASIRKVAGRYRRFPLLSSGSALINSAGLQLPTLLLAAFYGPQVAGWFALSQRVIGTPLGLVSQSTAQVFVGEASQIRRAKQEMLPLFWSTVKRQAYISLPVVLIIPLLPWVFEFLFGRNWYEAGIYAVTFSLALIFQFITSPVGGVLDVLERQGLHLLREFFRLLVLCLAILIGNTFNLGPRGTVALFSLSLMITSLVYLLISLVAIRQYMINK